MVEQVSFGRARLLKRPGVLLLDEPANDLDLAGVRQLRRALSAYRGR
ncbi:hypothetical protein ABGB18_02650 [Nonomuraea sp. B12E4]